MVFGAALVVGSFKRVRILDSAVVSGANPNWGPGPSHLLVHVVHNIKEGLLLVEAKLLFDFGCEGALLKSLHND